MSQTRLRFVLYAASLMLTWLAVSSSHAWAKSKEQVLYSFSGGADGAWPMGTLVFDNEGNLYGVTASGGAGSGVVFKLTEQNGKWSETVLYSFQGGNDGASPLAGLVFDQAGNLYGTTADGGGKGCFGGCGTVFELSPSPNGSWTETVLYRFTGAADGANPQANLILDDKGTLYGTTLAGGDLSCDTGGCGTVFELTSGAGGQWTETVLHAFAGGSSDGQESDLAGLIFDGSGNLYGTTALGGTADAGTVFELTPSGGGSWTSTILYSFLGGRDGRNPSAGLVFVGGNLFGTTYAGGTSCECGTAFKLSPQTGSLWKETVIHRFQGKDGIGPTFALTPDTNGNLYGTVFDGGSGQCNVCGTAFELLPPVKKQWRRKVLHHFGATLTDAGTPNGGLVLDQAGNLFGTSELGGSAGKGTVYEIAK